MTPCTVSRLTHTPAQTAYASHPEHAAGMVVQPAADASKEQIAYGAHTPDWHLPGTLSHKPRALFVLPICCCWWWPAHGQRFHPWLDRGGQVRWRA